MKVPDLSRNEIDYLIEQWVFNERDRALVRRKLFDAVTFERLAEEFDLSVRQTKNIYYKWTKKIFTKASHG